MSSVRRPGWEPGSGARGRQDTGAASLAPDEAPARRFDVVVLLAGRAIHLWYAAQVNAIRDVCR